MIQQAPAQELLACSQCARMFAHSDLVQIAGNWVCGDCKPAFLSRVMAGGAAVGPFGWHYGGFWIRFGARIIDGWRQLLESRSRHCYAITESQAVLIPNYVGAQQAVSGVSLGVVA